MLTNDLPGRNVGQIMNVKLLYVKKIEEQELVSEKIQRERV